MNNKKYTSPDFTFVDVGSVDIIRTSDIQAGLETTPLPDEDGNWEFSNF